MTYNVLDERSGLLRAEFSIADAVSQRGLVPVIFAAIQAWWSRPRLPPDLPAHLRADMGLPPEPATAHWIYIPLYPGQRSGHEPR